MAKPIAREASPVAAPPAVPRWDPVVRLTHWAIALAVVLNALIVEDESLIHVWIGFAALGFLLLRMIWGLFGTEAARFSSFPPSLSAAWDHVGDMLAGRHAAHRSHNPVGALMAYALWAMLAAVIATGLMMDSDPFPAAYQGGFLDLFRETERALRGGKFLEEIHEAAANMLLFLAVVHVGGVLFESWRSGVNLIRAMTTGGGQNLGRE